MEKIVTMFDDEWEDAVKDLSDRELADYVIRIYETISKDPTKFPEFTPQMMDHLRGVAEDFVDSLKSVEIAEQNVAISAAALDRSADAILRSMPDEDYTKGH